jgi:hypothetical protein
MNIIERVKNILLDPKKEWEVIKTENDTIQSLLPKYVIPLLCVWAIGSFLGYMHF